MNDSLFIEARNKSRTKVPLIYANDPGSTPAPAFEPGVNNRVNNKYQKKKRIIIKNKTHLNYFIC